MPCRHLRLAGAQRLVSAKKKRRLLPADCSRGTCVIFLSRVGSILPLARRLSSMCSLYTQNAFHEEDVVLLFRQKKSHILARLELGTLPSSSNTVYYYTTGRRGLFKGAHKTKHCYREEPTGKGLRSSNKQLLADSNKQLLAPNRLVSTLHPVNRTFSASREKETSHYLTNNTASKYGDNIRMFHNTSIIVTCYRIQQFPELKPKIHPIEVYNERW